MFPHVPLQAITLDLADTHSVSLTVDRILSNAVYIPGEEAMAAAATPTAGVDQVGGGDQEREATPPSAPPRNQSGGHVDDDAIADAQSIRYLEPHPQDHAPASSSATSSPVQVSHAQELRPGESQDVHDLRFSETLESHAQAIICDANTELDSPHGEYPDATPTASSDATPTASSHDLLPPELRRRGRDSEGIHTAKAISAASSPAPGEGGRRDSSDGVEEGNMGGKEFLSTGKSFSQLFSSLQERKAELLRKARR